MEKLDKVIAGLECCTERRCTKCPYLEQEMYCMTVLEKDALELLKVQKSMLEKASEVQKSGDLISRNALLSKMFPYGMPDNGNYGINARAVRDAVVAAKAIEAELVVHAHWVRLTPEQRDYFTDYTHCCSKCGEWGKKHYKRCRECGAVMDEKMPPEPTPLIYLDLGGRINKRLKQMGVATVEQLEAMDKHTLHNIPGLGRKSIETIETELRIWKELKEKKDGDGI